MFNSRRADGDPIAREQSRTHRCLNAALTGRAPLPKTPPRAAASSTICPSRRSRISSTRAIRFRARPQARARPARPQTVHPGFRKPTAPPPHAVRRHAKRACNLPARPAIERQHNRTSPIRFVPPIRPRQSLQPLQLFDRRHHTRMPSHAPPHISQPSIPILRYVAQPRESCLAVQTDRRSPRPLTSLSRRHRVGRHVEFCPLNSGAVGWCRPRCWHA